MPLAKLTSRIVRLLAGLFILLGGFVPASAAQPSPVPTALPASADLRAFQLVAPGTGWVLIGSGLYWTDSGGKRWRAVLPPIPAGSAIRAVSFADAHTGWLVAGSLAEAGQTFYLLQTSDSGASWQTTNLPLPADVAGLAGDLFLQLSDSRTGWLAVKQDTSSLFSLGTLFKTRDGGQTWERLAIPAGGPIHFANANDGVLDSGSPAFERYATHDGGRTWQRQTAEPKDPAVTEPENPADLSMATADAGWSKSVSGECQNQACQLNTQLLQTADGGRTWTAVPLPDGQTSLQHSFSAPPHEASSPAAAGSAPSLTLIYNGDGFDTCKIGELPSLDVMQNWFINSPYRVRNLYLGGASLPDCGHLTPAYVQSLAQQGWVFIPTWVGPQPPCANVAHKISWDLPTAYNQGLIDADLALNAAAALGFTLAGQSGTILYYDIEHYNPPPDNPACRQAMQAFINGWTAGLHAHGSLSGVYGSPCGSYVADMSANPNVPDTVWLARWEFSSYEQNVPVFGFSTNCLDDSLWTNSQRLRQYTGGHSEGWGGAPLTIDSDVIHGAVTTVQGACAPNANQVALFVYPHYGGACVIKGAGAYSTVPSLGLPNDAISSVKVGANVSLMLCEHEQQAGTCETFTSDTPELAGHPIGDNQASSAVVQSATASLTPRVFMPIFPLTSGNAGFPNGGFESGPADWITVSARQRTMIVTAGAVTGQGVTPHSGGWLAWLGSDHDETAYLLQTVAVPASAPYLAYWHWLTSAEASCSFDVVTVWVNNAAVNSYGLCTGANTNGWAKHVVNLSAYAGAQAAIRIQITTDDNLSSSLFLDDVSFQSLP